MAIPKFKNEPFTDFSKKSNRKDFQKALTKIKERFGKEFPIIIGSEEIYTDEKSASYNPSKPEEIIGVGHRSALSTRLIHFSGDRIYSQVRSR